MYLIIFEDGTPSQVSYLTEGDMAACNCRYVSIFSYSNGSFHEMDPDTHSFDSVPHYQQESE